MENIKDNIKSNHGYVYVLSNPSMPGLLKIGMTRFNPSRRVHELSSATGVPSPFQLVYYREFHDCVAAEIEIHSLLASKGLRYNDQREFFTIDTVEAINILLSLDNNIEDIDEVNEKIEASNYNEDIDWNEYISNRKNEIDKFCETDNYKKCKDLVYFKLLGQYPFVEEDTEKLKSYVNDGVYCYITFLACRLSFENIEEEITFILDYADKGYVSGYVDVITRYLDSIDGVENLNLGKKAWIANMLDKFARNFRNAAIGDMYIDQTAELYCGISSVLGFQYDKSFLKLINFEDCDNLFKESWLWGTMDALTDGETKNEQVYKQLRIDKDAYSGTSTQTLCEIKNNDMYKKYHTDEGVRLWRQGFNYNHGVGVAKDVVKAEELYYSAIRENYKKAYFPLATLYYSDKEKYFQILQEGALDSCPQCLILALQRIIADVGWEGNITKSIRKKVYRYLDLFYSQIDLAFWVDAEKCMDTIIIYVELSVAFGRKVEKRKLQEVITKIKSMPEIDMDLVLIDIGSSSCIFDDYELITQKTKLLMNELLGCV